MALLDPWDPVLEALTLRLVDITSGHVARSCGVAWDDGGWRLRFKAHRRGMEVALGARRRLDDDELPSDYQLGLVYGLGFAESDGDAARPEYIRGLQLREGGRWDEQTIREVVLESLGLLRYVLGCPGPDALSLDGVR